MILSRCPGCTTVFRVTPDQLTARRGMVRCGRCGTAFNALENVATGSASPEPQRSGETEPSLPPVPEPSTTKSPGSAGPGFEPVRDAVPEATAQIAPATATETRSEPFSALPPLPSPQPIASQPAVEVEFPRLLEPGTEAKAPAGPEVEIPSASEQAVEIIARPTRADEAPAPEASMRPLVEAAELAVTPPDTDAVSIGAELGPEQSRRPRLILTTGVAALTVLAVLQAAVVLRHGLAQSFPGMRPTLEALCEPFGCRIELPRRADLVSIETSDLQPDPKRKGQLILAAAIRNRAEFAQEVPHLELTLTDARDRALARRVFAPADYLPPGTDVRSGIGSGKEFAVHLVIDATSIGASGYRLYVFFP